MFQDRVTQTWVRYFGRKVTFENDPWIFGPTDNRMYRNISLEKMPADASGYEISPSEGIIDSIADFGLDSSELQRIHPVILDFYTRTSAFNMDMCFHWHNLFRPVAFVMKLLFSKRLQQLNIPVISSDELLKTHSFIMRINDRERDMSHNLWVRKFINAREVIFSGVYSVASTIKKQHMIKVQFPLPNGNATVFLEKKVMEDGNLELSSKGRLFGDSGFYFFLKGKDGYYAKYIKSMHEKLILTVQDDTSTIKGTHEFFFYKARFLTIDYTLRKKN